MNDDMTFKNIEPERNGLKRAMCIEPFTVALGPPITLFPRSNSLRQRRNERLIHSSDTIE